MKLTLVQSSAVEEKVVRPLAVLADLLLSPGRLCGKRNDKLMDFTAAASKLRQNRESAKKNQYEEELSQAKTTYEALNSQLVDELPALLELGTRVLTHCVKQFIIARKHYVSCLSKELVEIMEVIINIMRVEFEIFSLLYYRYTREG